ncbi:lipopolysaccharide heptosyltransferase family protein [Robbsia sp. Bb-Pol-6]|uniref:Lipopolysaccharide heptosyltransferase family protein n=1 Tax=Robbsia betulipollinis TaxID=2981849 RepID=A0ABT3ZP33_9BURK|nr:glycosyltransferase family 9 protein [Robbsia betulipollinis]MCY0388227.1 lipopolysaccharide heptosyltransferase family protein [Robbsia betulipollinis]
MVETTPVFRQVAVILSPALGDSLLLVTVAHNLQLNGARVTVFGQQGYLLRHWLPALRVRPALDAPAAKLIEVLAEFDAVLQLHDDKPFANLTECHPRVILLAHVFRSAAPYSMVDRLVEFCRDELKLPRVGRSNGLTPPTRLQHRRYRMRVAIHPTASTADKCWLAPRFLRLGLMLRKCGFDPQFVVAGEERSAWASVEAAGMMMPDLGSVDKLAGWLYESGWFIGNDSGVGHLASNLQIPTLSLFMRRGIARTWRPGWGAGDVLVGGAFLPSGRLKERYWKYMLSVGRVLRAFHRLRLETPLR